jgi:glucose/arabinose dehydrogenase/cytochrome c553
MRFSIRLLPFLAVLSATGARAALPVPDADDGGIRLPPGFRALVVADNLVVGRKSGTSDEKLRFLAIAPNGDIYAKIYHTGGILAMRDTKGDGRVDLIKEFGATGGTAVAFHDGWLYHSSRTAVFRYKYTPGELVPSGEPETIVYGLPAEKDHDAKSFAFDDQGHMLVEIGSPYNVYSNPDRQFGAKGMDATEFQKTHGGFWIFDPNKPNQTIADGRRWATGERHTLALVWNPSSRNFFNVMMGRDNMNIVDPEHYDALDNAERVSEEMHVLREGINLGWPYTYWDPIKQERMVAPEFGGDNHKRDTSGAYDKPVIAFPGHWAPLQMAYYSGTQFPARYQGGMFIAFHGSWNRAPLPQAGYKVAFIPFNAQGMPTGDYETFADGFSGLDSFTVPGDARFRPCGVAVGPDGSLYVGDTEKGRIWRIIYTGETRTTPGSAAALRPAPERKPLDDGTHGGRLYGQICAICHMADGSGVSSMQPALVNDAVVGGDPTVLIRVILKGPAAVLPADRTRYSNVMPPFASALSDRDIADVATFLRRVAGGGASAVSPEQVAALRAQ